MYDATLAYTAVVRDNYTLISKVFVMLLQRIINRFSAGLGASSFALHTFCSFIAVPFLGRASLTGDKFTFSLLQLGQFKVQNTPPWDTRGNKMTVVTTKVRSFLLDAKVWI
jgi:hypothetical protein